jgi:hypothetical protein
MARPNVVRHLPPALASLDDGRDYEVRLSPPLGQEPAAITALAVRLAVTLPLAALFRKTADQPSIVLFRAFGRRMSCAWRRSDAIDQLW